MQLADSIRKARQVKNKLSHPSCAAVIVAAGSSARMGGTDKLLAELGGLPVLSRTLRVFDDHEMIDTIIVVAREDPGMPKISPGLFAVSEGAHRRSRRRESTRVGDARAQGCAGRDGACCGA